MRNLDETFLPAHNARFGVEPGDAQDAHRPTPAQGELDAALCPVRQRRVADRSGLVSWRGRCLELVGPDAMPRRRQVVVRVRLDGQVQLLNVTDGRVLPSREVAPRQAPSKPQPPLVERVAAHAGPPKPSATHPWRKSPAVAPPTRGHFYSDEQGDISTSVATVGIVLICPHVHGRHLKPKQNPNTMLERIKSKASVT